jgi:serpin B
VTSACAGNQNAILGPRAITDRTILVLTNALYFRGLWEVPFDAKLTRDAPFHTDAGEVIVPTMRRQRGKVRIARNEDHLAVELPYQSIENADLTLVILLPHEGRPLAQLEQALGERGLDELTGGGTMREVDLRLPRFKVRLNLDLFQHLVRRGLGRSVCGGEVSAVIHEAVVETDEAGTIAAGATAVIVTVSKGRTLRIDRPFLFAIRDVRSGLVLFLARVSDPRGGAKI